MMIRLFLLIGLFIVGHCQAAVTVNGATPVTIDGAIAVTFDGITLVIPPSFVYDYCVRADGSAANKAAATSCDAASTSMSVTTFNSETFSDDDEIAFSSLGGDFTAEINLPSGGSSGHPIIYKGDPSNIPTWTSYSWNIQKSYVEVNDITVTAVTTQSFLFGEMAITSVFASYTHPIFWSRCPAVDGAVPVSPPAVASRYRSAPTVNP